MSKTKKEAEIWQPIPNNIVDPGYEVSNFGRVRSYRKLGRPGTGDVTTTPRILTPRISKLGQLVITLHKNGRPRTCTVYRLVALAFVPNPKNLRYARHANYDTSDVYYGNLYWSNQPGGYQKKNRKGY